MTSFDATQAEETGSIRKEVIALGIELPLTEQHPMQVSKCHLSLETDASRSLREHQLSSFQHHDRRLRGSHSKGPLIFLPLLADEVILWATGSNIHPLEDALNSSLLNLGT
ncbi:hypothetical protein TNIN_344591 [Trichonephila inaurata madagascariensis]|uniref:Uncharacterized protein n=1 Tax=Trichonephila inaurata madagascariensis TaxID=2747483 RepID=A0A8X6IDB1_9ARAC|nr:hypothetical protein TNIN_344591 [Trichonephila inaurata madagascariensis]